MHEPGDTQADEAAVPVPHERMTETWKPVVGYEGLYAVSDHGRVRGPKGRVLASCLNSTGRPNVVLFKDGTRKNSKPYTLVLEAFVGPRPDGMECCHLDDDPTNNHLSNLRWDTRSANSFDAIRNGRHSTASKTVCVRGHDLTPDNVWVSRIGRRHCRACWKARKQEKKTVRV